MIFIILFLYVAREARANFWQPRPFSIYDVHRLALHAVGVVYFEEDLMQIVKRSAYTGYVVLLRRVGKLAYIKLC